MSTAVQRTMRLLRSKGAICAVVERWNPHVGPHGIRQDLFGFVDVLELRPGVGFVAIQCCTTSFAAHLRKLLEERTQEVIDWLQTPGGRVELWAWRKVKVKRGGKAVRWEPRIRQITLGDLKGEG